MVYRLGRGWEGILFRTPQHIRPITYYALGWAVLCPDNRTINIRTEGVIENWISYLVILDGTHALVVRQMPSIHRVGFLLQYCARVETKG